MQGCHLLPRFTNKTDRICEVCDRVYILKFLLHQAEKYNSDSYEKLELDWKVNASFGCILVTTEPPLEDLIDRKAKLLHKTRLRHPMAGFLSEGCLKSRLDTRGVKRRRLWPDFDPSLAQLWIKSCKTPIPSGRDRMVTCPCL